MKLILETDDPAGELMNLANLLIKLRYTTKYWEEHYGALPRNAKKYWEKKADEWLTKNLKEIEE